MKISLIRIDNENGKAILTVCGTGTLFAKMKIEAKSGYVTALRELIPMLKGTDSRYEHIDKLPYIYSAVEYIRTREGERKLKQYNGLVQLEVNNLAGLSEVEYVKQQAALLPQTFAAFCGSSGRSVKIWVRFALPDDEGLPATEAQAELFHAHAYWLAVKCYQPILPFDIDLKEVSLTQRCRMTLDQFPYYNPSAVPFCLEQPLTMPGEETFRQRKQGEKNPLLRLEPGYESSKTLAKIYEAALNRAFREMEGWKRGNDLRPLLVHLAEHCFKAGIPEEEAVRQTLIHYYRQEDEQIIRSTFRNLYLECKGFGKKSSIGREQGTAFLLEEFMNRRYEFRYNTVLDDLEYRQRDSLHFYFKPMDKRVRNSISICALKEGIAAWDRDVDRFLHSEYVPLYNPVEEYLCDVGRWDGKDRIRALANLVTCTNPHWQELFYRWFLSMVAHWRGVDRQHGNSTSPLLVGSQGYRKSTFCRMILPPELRFGYTDSINFTSKQEAERYLGRFFLINIDEFDQINVNQQGFLKHLLQKPVANLRKPYGNTIREMRRYASFIGTSNQKDLLTDPSGSRRFICIEVTAPINTSVAINYKQLYAQAMDAIYGGERYWLNDEDEKILKQTNREFEQESPLEQLFHCYLRAAEEGESGEWMTCMQVLNYLQTKTRDRLAITKVARFGRTLQKLNIPCRKSNRGTVYCLVKVE
ncbi:BT4734/BF3469 family protein [Bacteroides sp. UBA939]|uniref:BT4734/BF3469 family protein n=1 Tax=Bacteroides sp. UBA939 TaxID=1946092 RepID=UPI0025C1BE58|nr:BT4734/BF3469 family protein [Bacteroides sp. UBA939]